jgi:hypothetical protein
MASTPVKLALGGTALAAVAYYFYKKNQDEAAAKAVADAATAAALDAATKAAAADALKKANLASKKVVTVSPEQVAVVQSLVGRDVSFVMTKNGFLGELKLLDEGRPGDASALSALYAGMGSDQETLFRMSAGVEYLTFATAGMPINPTSGYQKLFGVGELAAALNAAGIDPSKLKAVTFPTIVDDVVRGGDVAKSDDTTISKDVEQKRRRREATDVDPTEDAPDIKTDVKVDVGDKVLDEYKGAPPPAEPVEAQSRFLTEFKGRSVDGGASTTGGATFVVAGDGLFGVYPVLDLINTASKLGKIVYYDHVVTIIPGSSSGSPPPSEKLTETLYLMNEGAAAPTTTAKRIFNPADLGNAVAAAGVATSSLGDVPMPSARKVFNPRKMLSKFVKAGSKPSGDPKPASTKSPSGMGGKRF